MLHPPFSTIDKFMLEFLADLGSFAAKAAIIVIAFGMLVAIIAANRKSQQEHTSGKLVITDLGRRLREQQRQMLTDMNHKPRLKQLKKQRKEAAKSDKARSKKQPGARPTTYVIDFNGDIRASQTTALSHKITALLQLANPKQDQAVIRLESAGGLVHAYGLAAAQLERLKQQGIHCTICIDKLAASGGYMMACIATQIVAAPFALVGSIGVVAQLPNFHRLLQRWEVDIEQHTAGKFKRTLTALGKNTPEGRRKFKQDIERTHKLFQDLVKEHRPQLALTKVATGEIWYGREALKLKLVDEINTSSALLLAQCAKGDVFLLDYKEKRSLSQRLQNASTGVLENLLLRAQQRDYEQRLINQL